MTLFGVSFQPEKKKIEEIKRGMHGNLAGSQTGSLSHTPVVLRVVAIASQFCSYVWGKGTRRPVWRVRKGKREDREKGPRPWACSGDDTAVAAQNGSCARMGAVTS